jgi:hypothetical protein
VPPPRRPCPADPPRTTPRASPLPYDPLPGYRFAIVTCILGAAVRAASVPLARSGKGAVVADDWAQRLVALC